MLTADIMILGLFCTELCWPIGKQRCFRESFGYYLCLQYTQVIHSDSHRCHRQSGIYPIRGISSSSHEAHGVCARWTWEFVDDVTLLYGVRCRYSSSFTFRCSLVTLINRNVQLVFVRDYIRQRVLNFFHLNALQYILFSMHRVWTPGRYFSSHAVIHVMRHKLVNSL